ncbi:transposase IS605 OrfB [Desulfurobacterium thermolithotrophum DSM 11699]|uniref:Transposase IS605 OrfB n=1 Tax=Desulfurobacterium thermolithotrophum (strain DSM 11699 / BSA) TaxID=868864 RepID=F0S3B7_DESTD|nr:RNA-guided endonuclease TnpB family protein [Desulfurobacterium thermolithotrophum]ADY73339.1 transposase IS605 OrfB [Desulfurobacterium thermolithotrophum DSM 11699]
MKTAKAEKIKQTLKETKERRENQVCRVYQLKLQNLSKKDIEKLDRLFLEAKWLRNFVVADIENRIKDYKYKEVEIKTPEGFDKREIKLLSSQMKQEIIDQIKDDLKSLKKSKEKGNKVGKLKFKSEVRTIPLKQYGVTYKISGDRNRVKVQGIKKKFRVLGLHQIPENAEITKGYLIKKPSGYYLHIVCYLPKEEVEREIREKQIQQPVGIDLGIKHQLTLSTGEKLSWYIPETKRLKRLQKILSRKQKGSRNYQKVKKEIGKEWEYIYNKRQDALNKAISCLKRFSLIAVQDDSIEGWKKGLFGKQIQNTGIGGVTARLRSLATLISVFFVDRYEPTTQTCSFCGYRQEISLSERVFKCEGCGIEIDRDVNSAREILKVAIELLLWMLRIIENGGEGKLLKILPVDGGEVTPVERGISLVEAGSPSL